MSLAGEIDASSLHLLYAAHTLIARNETSNSTTSATNEGRPAVYKIIGLSLAVASGLFIGISFVLKKVGLLKANVKYNEEAGEGYGYLKNVYWWGGMILMIVGEVCNFVAYAFTDAILVTPLGALSVVVTTILSAIFLKERLSFVGKVGCFLCIVGSVVIVLNAPEQSAVADIQQMKHFVIAPGFLTYAGIIIVGSTFIALWVGPRYGKKSMFVYLSVCSFIGGLSVVATQGLGAAVVAQASKGNQFNQWFLYVLLVFVVATLLTEIVYLNKALNIFNAALVTPTYYVFFTSTTIITSAILFRGFHGTAVTIATVVMGFLVICSGVVLLQLSKSAKDVPDAAIFKGDLDQVREVAEQEAAESEPKADAIRGAASIIRRLSTPRRQMEQMEAKRIREEKLSEHLEPLKENEIAEWDGIRRRKTVVGSGLAPSPIVRRKTLHPPLGMTQFPEDSPDRNDGSNKAFLDNVRERAHGMFGGRHKHDDDDTVAAEHADPRSPEHPVALTNIRFPKSGDGTSPALPYGPGSLEEAQEHIYGHPGFTKKKPMPSPRSKPLPASPAPTDSGLRPPAEAKRQFSFSNFLRHSKQSGHSTDTAYARPSTATSHLERKAAKTATEEERMGLTKGDSSRPLMGETSPERKQGTLQPIPSRESHEPSDTASLYEAYPYTQSQRHHRSASPDAMLDEGMESDSSYQGRQQTYHEPFSFSSKGPTTGQQTPQQRTPSRRRPSPPAIYTPPPPILSSHLRDLTQSSERATQLPPIEPPASTTTRRITIGDPPPASRPAPSLDPPVQFAPSSRQAPSTQLNPIYSSQSPDDAGPSEYTSIISRGRPIATAMQQNPSIYADSASSTRSDNSNNGSKDRFAEQSARERAERRERAQRRQSQGPDSATQGTDFS
ncbi:hypothetical protein LTS08_005794 [Lithohypha guttulata]|uniref:DUF803-domain-containing protein n=1 Tax=Lithohypha guttulata TaxID=1690604 RepID=A0AAN7TAS8_9EURO|nr:hypothetical protein LTR51_002307 [Lithohypha guttulata]KAK5089969.1 hypothetical protein LTR05_000137 [Lithohypha guttulata]KAK5099214.1 hypothetical protein LTS08_005794 [Lithohypha guttulata]